MNIIFFLLTPITKYLEYKLNKWRETIKIGDKVYFINVLGSHTECTVLEVKNDEALVESSGMWTSSQWLRKKILYPIIK